MHLLQFPPSDVTVQTLVGGDPVGEELKIRQRKRATKIARLQSRLISIQQQIDDLAQEGIDDIAAYKKYLEDEVVPDRLSPDATPSLKKRVAKWFKIEKLAAKPRDDYEVDDLRKRLDGSDWEIEDVSRDQFGELRVKLIHLTRSLPDPKQIVANLVSKVKTILPLILMPDPDLAWVKDWQPQGP